MKNKSEEAQKVIRWFSGLDVETMQQISKPVSELLNGFNGFKEKRGTNCRIRPCNKRVYSRGVCQRHYHYLNEIAKVTGWLSLVRVGFCKVTHREAVQALKEVDITAKQNDPLSILIRKP